MYDYFQEQDSLLVIDNMNPLYNKSKLKSNDHYDEHEFPKKQFYEFLPFHPVTVSSEMVGTSVEELLHHNYPSKRSWENSRMCEFPQELIVRLEHRSHVKFVILRSKVNRPIQEVNIYIGDGIYGNFNDTEYRKAA